MKSAPGKPASRYFGSLLIAIIFLYGLWATILSMQTINAQSTVRTNLLLALDTLHRLHSLSLAAASGQKTEQADIRRAWKNRRSLLLASPQAAKRLEAALLQKWNHAGVKAGCGSPNPPFAQAPAPASSTARACHVFLYRRGAILGVTGYDTQGQAMDNFYEYLYPPATQATLRTAAPPGPEKQDRPQPE